MDCVCMVCEEICIVVEGHMKMECCKHYTSHFTVFFSLFQTNGHSSVGGDLVYQERLSRLESDKECLVLQVGK